MNRHNPSPYEVAKARLRWLASAAKVAAARQEWIVNHRLCREHDDLVLELRRKSRMSAFQEHATTHALIGIVADMLEAHGEDGLASKVRDCKDIIPDVPVSPPVVLA